MLCDLYDALNRPTKITRADASVVNFYYDQGSNGIGHLTGISDPSGSSSWSYDANGHVIQKQQTIGSLNLTTSWSYNATTGQLQTMTLPSTKVISYTWTNGQITALKLNGAALLSSIAYDTFDGPKSWTFANGQSIAIARDQNGRITSDAIESSFTYDPASNITAITLGGLSSYDADGSVTADGTNTYTYNAAERLVTAKHGAVTVNYLQDGLGERVQKSNSTGTTNFIYGLQGQLIGEYGAGGSLVEETVYLGRLPVAVATPAGTYYVLTDHLGTPQADQQRIEPSRVDLGAGAVWQPTRAGLDPPPFIPNSAKAGLDPPLLNM